MFETDRKRDRILPILRDARAFTERKLVEIRSNFSSASLPDGISIFVVGSYARKDATENSDLDYLLYSDLSGSQNLGKIDEDLRRCLTNLNIAHPATGGAFGDGHCKESDFVKNIGGNNESNRSLTRRMLLILESDAITNDAALSELREKIIARYISEDMTEHGLARFLLNDLVKFYRTMCVDFEYKTVEDGKDWGTRNIKLAFSRKLIYFSGVLAVAETAQRHWKQKREYLQSYFAMTPIERLEKIYGSVCEPALESYERFVEMLADNEKKDRFSNVTSNRSTHTDEFRELKNEAQHFSWHLSRILNHSYPHSHPIHHALVF